MEKEVSAKMLIDKLNGLNKEQWAYYRNSHIVFENYQEAFADPHRFIEDYFHIGGKQSLLIDSIEDLIGDNKDDEEYKKRRRHIVTTFFLGAYIYEQIEFLHFRKQSYLGENRRYLWAWFLCSLYHDLFYNKEIEGDATNPPRYAYCKFSSRLLYSKDILSKYYKKELNKELCHSARDACGIPHFDHGIAAAEQLHNSYLEKVIGILCAENEWKGYLSGEVIGVYGGHLKISLDDYFAICKIAKVIACHNVYVYAGEIQKGKDKERDKYVNADLSSLIDDDPNFHYLPIARASGEIGNYEKLYFLLALVDTLEPTKRDIGTAKIDINIEKKESHYEISISGGNQKYLDSVKKMGTWLNFVKVSDDGRTLIIDFKNDKNKRNDDRVAEE